MRVALLSEYLFFRVDSALTILCTYRVDHHCFALSLETNDWVTASERVCNDTDYLSFGILPDRHYLVVCNGNYVHVLVAPFTRQYPRITIDIVIECLTRLPCTIELFYRV